jgi:hypothetical protein
MPDDVRVLDDAVDQEKQARVPSQWVWLLIGLVVGLGAGVVLLGPAMGPTATTAVVGDTAPVLPGAPFEELGIAEEIPDFPDALVAISRTQIGSYDYVLWPTDTGDVVRSLPIASPGLPTLDVSGRWIAATTDLDEPGTSLLSMGQVSGISPIFTGVTSHAWHDSEDRLLGYTGVADGEWELWVASPHSGEELVMRRPANSEDVRLAAWGEWGFALSYPDRGAFDLITPEGDLKTVVSGTPLGSHESGWILVVEDTVTRLVSAGGGVQAVTDFPQVEGSTLAGAISPDGRRVAVLGSNGLVVGSIDGSEEAVVVDVGLRHYQVSWSSDSRFVLAPALPGATVYDTVSGDVFSILRDRLVVWVGVIPLTTTS